MMATTRKSVATLIDTLYLIFICISIVKVVELRQNPVQFQITKIYQFDKSIYVKMVVTFIRLVWYSSLIFNTSLFTYFAFKLVHRIHHHMSHCFFYKHSSFRDTSIHLIIIIEPIIKKYCFPFHENQSSFRHFFSIEIL